MTDKTRAFRGIFVILALTAVGAAHAGTLDQRAANLYDTGVRMIRQGSFSQGEQLLRAALDRGAVQPTDAQGSESRFLVRRYDPYYWLGVANMEMGRSSKALRYFETSESFIFHGTKTPVISRWPREYEDLKRRKAELLRDRQEEPGD